MPLPPRIDRLKSARGVVDFIDIGIGAWRWPTFNVADIAVTTGAILLAVVLWNSEAPPATSTAPQPPVAGEQSTAGVAG